MLIGGVAGVIALVKYRTKGWFGRGAVAPAELDSSVVPPEDVDQTT